jgi:hypothetical protein
MRARAVRCLVLLGPACRSTGHDSSLLTALRTWLRQQAEAAAGDAVGWGVFCSVVGCVLQCCVYALLHTGVVTASCHPRAAQVQQLGQAAQQAAHAGGGPKEAVAAACGKRWWLLRRQGGGTQHTDAAEKDVSQSVCTAVSVLSCCVMLPLRCARSSATQGTAV